MNVVLNDRTNSQTSSPEGEGTDKSPTPETEGQETGRPTEPKEDYAEKFRASSRESLRLLDENRKLMEREAAISAKLSAIETEKRELEELAKGNNPEGYDSLKLRRHIEGLNSEMAQMKERLELDGFVGSVPEAGAYRDTLRDLGRAYPGKSYRDIWETSLKPVAEASAAAKAEKAERRTAAPDMGNGSPTGEPSAETICGMSLEKFNKLPLERRKELFRRNNIHYEAPGGK